MGFVTVTIFLYLTTVTYFSVEGTVCKCRCTSNQQNGQSGLMGSPTSGVDSRTATEPSNPFAISELIKYALEQKSPFPDKMIEKIKGGFFSSPRAKRTCDFVVVNTSPFTLDLDYGNTDCTDGGWSSELLPPDIIEAKTSAVFGADSVGGIPGAFEGVWCAATYTTGAAQRVYMVLKTPMFGDSVAYIDTTGLQGEQISHARFIDVDISNVGRFTLKK